MQGYFMQDQDNLDNVKDTEIVWLATADSEIEGMMWAEAIRDHGIPVLVRPGGPGAGAWASAATFQHALYVRKRDIETARDILVDWRPEEPSAPPRRRTQAPRVRRRWLRKSG